MVATETSGGPGLADRVCGFLGSAEGLRLVPLTCYQTRPRRGARPGSWESPAGEARAVASAPRRLTRTASSTRRGTKICPHIKGEVGSAAQARTRRCAREAGSLEKPQTFPAWTPAQTLPGSWNSRARAGCGQGAGGGASAPKRLNGAPTRATHPCSRDDGPPEVAAPPPPPGHSSAGHPRR